MRTTLPQEDGVLTMDDVKEGQLVYKSVGSALAKVKRVDWQTEMVLIEYQYTVGRNKAGAQEAIEPRHLIRCRARRANADHWDAADDAA
jgi:hypothetical protein